MKKKMNVQAKTNNLSFRLQKTAVYTTFLLAILMISRASENRNKRTTTFRYLLLLSSPSTPHSLKTHSMCTSLTRSRREWIRCFCWRTNLQDARTHTQAHTRTHPHIRTHIQRKCFKLPARLKTLQFISKTGPMLSEASYFYKRMPKLRRDLLTLLLG